MQISANILQISIHERSVLVPIFAINNHFKSLIQKEVWKRLGDGLASVPGVYAVGDVRTKPLRQVVTAVADGAVAVHMAEKYIAENR